MWPCRDRRIDERPLWGTEARDDEGESLSQKRDSDFFAATCLHLMPGHAAKLSDDQIKGMVEYVKGLGK